MKGAAFALLWLLSGVGGVEAFRTQNVFIVVVDGARYTETFGDSTHRYIPRMWNQLRPLGTIFTRFYNDSITMTSSGHATIVTGAWQSIADDGAQRTGEPTIFEYFRKQTGRPASDCYLILGKDKLKTLAYSADSVDHGEAFGASVQTSDSFCDDLAVWNNIRTVIGTHHPRLAAANLPNVDCQGHAGDWDSYGGAIRQADSLIGELWSHIQSDSVYGNRTTLIIVNDHGRHTNDFTSHGDTCEGCRHLMLMMVGPDTPAGAVDSTRRLQIDLAPTVGALLGFATPRSTGAVLEGDISPAFVVRKPGERPSRPTPQPFPNQPARTSLLDVRGRLVADPARPTAGRSRLWWDARGLARAGYVRRTATAGVLPGHGRGETPIPRD